jgi:hypothetical protein
LTSLIFSKVSVTVVDFFSTTGFWVVFWAFGGSEFEFLATRKTLIH